MPGGLLNLVSTGQQNILLNGNPSKSFFKSTYRKYTNFGLQKFRVDFEGSKSLRLTEESTFTFKIPRYADLLMDCYLSVNMPNIWSPILPPQPITDITISQNLGNVEKWAPYDFKWIEYLGAKLITKISITCGNYTLQEYSGDYLLASVQRDFNGTKRLLFDSMIGHTPEMMNPANSDGRINSYPNAYYSEDSTGAEPSIRGRTLYIPLNNWFGLKSQMAFPLISLQYNELHINITCRPINELFVIRDVMDETNNYPYVAPNFNQWYMQFYRFLQPPPDIELGINSYVDKRELWNTDIHLNCTYCFLSNEEEKLFATMEQKYLIKQVKENIFHNVTGPNKIQLDSVGLVADWLFYFQRSDANLRNEWSNYTNWPYNYLPINVIMAPTSGDFLVYRDASGGELIPTYIGPGVNPDGNLTGFFINQTYNPQNDKMILIAMGILFDGAYRENIQPAGVYNFIEKYVRTSGYAPAGLYCYNFCLDTNNSILQPSGAINMSRFSQIELEFTTIIPPLDPLAQSLTICDPETGNIIGINKPTWRIYDYNFDLHLFEERINVVYFLGGNVGMVYAT
jgi:hypothetical protein